MAIPRSMAKTFITSISISAYFCMWQPGVCLFISFWVCSCLPVCLCVCVSVCLMYDVSRSSVCSNTGVAINATSQVLDNNYAFLSGTNYMGNRKVWCLQLLCHSNNWDVQPTRQFSFSFIPPQQAWQRGAASDRSYGTKLMPKWDQVEEVCLNCHCSPVGRREQKLFCDLNTYGGWGLGLGSQMQLILIQQGRVAINYKMAEGKLLRGAQRTEQTCT